MTLSRRLLATLCVLATPLVLVAALLVGVAERPTSASSHREAPLIAKDAFADGADTYVWIPQGVTDRVVLAATYIPFEGPEGGPNYWEWDDNVTYKIHVDNDGDAVADFTYSLRSNSTTTNPATFLYNTGPIDSLTDADWNLKQTYTVTEEVAGGATTNLVTNVSVPPQNLGPKSVPNYAALETAAIYSYAAPEGPIQIFAGSTDDPFWVDLQVFDLLTLRGQASPVGYPDGPNMGVDSLSGYNVHSLIIELPIAHLTAGGQPILGVWATAERGGAQVSRLGMPLVNEVVIPLGVKDAFNTLRPDQDLGLYGSLQPLVEDPELGNLLCALYGVPLPDDADDDCDSDYTAGTPRSVRGDIFDVFLQGMVLANPFTVTTAGGPVVLPAGFNVNRPTGAVPAEMIRINTGVSGTTCHPTPQRLGVLAGDACGFPNGRRPVDDIVEIELAAVAGAAHGALDGRDASFTFNPALLGVLDDGVDANDRPFRTTFPYFAPAQSGRTHYHTNEFPGPTTLSFGNLTLSTGSAPWLQVVAALASIGVVGTFEWLRRRRQN